MSTVDALVMMRFFPETETTAPSSGTKRACPVHKMGSTDCGLDPLRVRVLLSGAADAVTDRILISPVMEMFIFNSPAALALKRAAKTPDG
jgi:hypothetical protein